VTPNAVTSLRSPPRPRGRSPLTRRLARRLLGGLALAAVAPLLGGCDWVLLAPAGDVALQQRNLLLASTGLMLIIILPVMALTLLFAWHYRASNRKAVYDPDFHHSTALEVAIWTVPLLIIVALGALTWMGTHLLDPYRPIGRISAAKPLLEGKKASEAKETVEPLEVQVVAMDWKWLFFYPKQGIATVNELAAPVDVPIRFRLTSQAVMNAFFVPTLAGMIYAMPGMETKLHAVVNRAGTYKGLSSNYSGAGFSRMHFPFHGLDQAAFDAWVAKAKASGETLDRARYAELEKPSEGDPARLFAGYDPGLYDAILNLCTKPGAMCMSEMMHIDARGGGGKESEGNLERLRYDGARTQEGNEAPGATVPASGRPARGGPQPQGMRPDAVEPRTNAGGAPSPASDPHAGHGSHGAPAPSQIQK
jgi:cytochrome o ubiquinol oxidase subunit II